jgi:nickel-dependent lactate racemase
MVAGKIVGLCISDEFRAGLQAQIAEAMMLEIDAGKPAQLRVFIATGTHDPAVYCKNLAPLVEKIGERLSCPLRVIRHDCDRSRFVDVGTTPLGTLVRVEADWMETEVRVHGHEAKHHYMAGYSMIDKHIVPGVASRLTVEQNHKRSLSPNSAAGRNPWVADPARQDNPFSIDGRDARALTERFLLLPDGTLAEQHVDTFALDMISEKEDVFWVLSGDPTLICREVPAKADEVALYTVEPARYVVISPGGPPASTALYGVQNCFDMALLGAIEKGGEALVVAPCDGRPDLPDGVRGIAPDAKSTELFWANLVRLRDTPLDECFQYISDHFELYMWKTYRVLRNFKQDRLRIYLHTQLPDDLVRQGGFLPAPDIDAWVREREARGDGAFRVIDGGNKLCVVSGRTP